MAEDVQPVRHPNAQPRFETPESVEASVRRSAVEQGIRDASNLLSSECSGVIDWMGLICTAHRTAGLERSAIIVVTQVVDASSPLTS